MKKEPYQFNYYVEISNQIIMDEKTFNNIKNLYKTFNYKGSDISYIEYLRLGEIFFNGENYIINTSKGQKIFKTIEELNDSHESVLQVPINYFNSGFVQLINTCEDSPYYASWVGGLDQIINFLTNNENVKIKSNDCKGEFSLSDVLGAILDEKNQNTISKKEYESYCKTNYDMLYKKDKNEITFKQYKESKDCPKYDETIKKMYYESITQPEYEEGQGWQRKEIM